MDKGEKEALVAECRASGVMAKEWCEAKGLNNRSYIDWASIINKEKRQSYMVICNGMMLRTEYGHGEVKLISGKWTIAAECSFSPTRGCT